MLPASIETVNSATRQATEKTEADQPIHFESLRARCLGDEEFCRGLVQNSLERAAQHLASIDRAMADARGREIAQQAHAISGIAANLSAHELRSWAAALERATRGGNLQSMRPIIARVRAEFERCAAAVPQLLAQFSDAQRA
jgi:HPt (histidine-containing phosphotransfer) domain-containing protein